MAPQPETAAPVGESGAPATFSAVASAELGTAVVTTSMDTPTALQVVEYYHLDAIGSVRAVTDADENVIARHDFLPFGEELSPQIPPRDRKLFTGQERDFETGLDYFFARQLRVDLGRFTAPDPMADLAWGDPIKGATNAYGYVMNNPLGFIDPTGAYDQIVVHPAHINWDNHYWDWDSQLGTYVCADCGAALPPGTFGSNTTIMTPGFLAAVENQLQLTPMGAGVLSFFPGRGPAGPGAGFGPQAPVAAGAAQPQSRPPKSGCTQTGLWAGLKAAGQDLIPIPPEVNPDPIGATGDVLASKQVQTAALGVLYEVADGARYLAPLADAAADYVPIAGQLWFAYQVGHALYEGAVAYKEAIDQCYGGR